MYVYYYVVTVDCTSVIVIAYSVFVIVRTGCGVCADTAPDSYCGSVCQTGCFSMQTQSIWIVKHYFNSNDDDDYSNGGHYYYY